MSIITLKDITLSFGGLPILERLDLQVEAGERVCLVGRNGEGKSSLMKMINGGLPPDDGTITMRQGLKVSMLEQKVPHEMSGTVYDVVAGALGSLFGLLSRYHDVSQRLSESGDERLMAELETVQHELETAGGWHAGQQVETVISRLKLDAEASFSELSGGLKRRVLLARALVTEPDLLLLDEPTNHLDIEAITRLEEFLLNCDSTLFFVTHDRMLLQNLATRIVELDRGNLTSWPGDYQLYLKRKEQMLEVEAGHRAKFDKKLAREEAWIRQGIKARRTRNEGRVKALQEMRQERKARRERLGTAKMELHEAEKSGKLVIKAKNIGKSYNNMPVVENLTTTILRGDKVGIIGPNGSGKTTLLRMLVGELEPDAGSIRFGTNLQVAYFDQLRSRLNEEKTVAENIGDGNDTVIINGRPKHIIGYLQDFLFTPDRARSPVKILSGGERNRLLLARLFAKPSNVLVLDEPTNDLDIETLELLEELLLEYKGTVLLVSHDRAFLNNVVTGSLVFEGKGRVVEYAGGYDDWLMQRPGEVKDTPAPKTSKKNKSGAVPDRPRKLTFKEKFELEELPGKIEAIEAEQQDLFEKMADPEFYRNEGPEVSKVGRRAEEIEHLLAEMYERWDELETVRNRSTT